MEQLVVEELVVDGGIVDGQVEATDLHIFRLCLLNWLLSAFLEPLAQFFRVHVVSSGSRWTASSEHRLDHSTLLLLVLKLPLRFLQRQFGLTLVAVLKVILCRCVVGSHR